MQSTGSSRVVFLFGLALGAALTGACEVEKSSNPLSPSVAGPIPGVDITQPKLIEPGQGFKYRAAQQPIKLVIENAVTSGVRPLSYTFEVAADSNFTTKLFARAGVPPGPNGRTTVQIDKLDLGRAYFWRARAGDGANTGPFAAARFEVLPTPSLSRPTPLIPIDNVVVPERRPTLRVRNADRNAGVGALAYLFQIAKDQSFGGIVNFGTVTETPGETAWTVEVDLEFDAVYYWRARATDSETTGDWSAAQSFRSTPSSGGGGGGGGGGGDGGGGGGNEPCGPPYPNNGPAVVACVESKYPERLAAGVSLSQRKANMAFLRDRIIETGICGGMELGWNMKRGGPEKSIDFLAWHDGKQWIGVDIGRAYDATHRKLDLVWGIYGPTPHARVYAPRPTCN